MLTEVERDVAAKAAFRFPKKNGELFIARHLFSWTAKTAAKILASDGEKLCCCPATSVALHRGDATEAGLLSALDDVCRYLRLDRGDFCQQLDNNPKLVARELGWGMRRDVRRNGSAGKG